MAIVELKTFLETKPFGIQYKSKNMDEVVDSEFTNAVITLEQKLSEKAGKPTKIFDGSNLLMPISEIIKLINAEQPKKKVDEAIVDKPNKDKTVESIQKIFNHNPFGLTYNGEIDGILGAELAGKLAELENKISETIKVSVKNKIISGNKVTTTADELLKTFKIIDEYRKFIKSQIK